MTDPSRKFPLESVPVAEQYIRNGISRKHREVNNEPKFPFWDSSPESRLGTAKLVVGQQPM